MQRALRGLEGVSAGQKHVIIISDGDPDPPPPTLLDRYVAAKVSVSTVMVGGHGTALHRRGMNAIATVTGGRFHDVQSPANLPGIFIQEAQVVSRSLVQEGAFSPQWQGPGGGPLPAGAIDAVGALPGIDGYVLTEAMGGLAQDAIAIPTEQADDPLYAWAYQGLGRVVAFTSDLGARWTRNWAGWEGELPLWERTVSWLIRPRDDGLLSLSLQDSEDGEVVVDVEAMDADAGFLNFLQTQAVVMGPGGASAPLSLKQIGPGQYRGSFRMGDVDGGDERAGGGWVVGVRYRGTRPESGDPVEGWVQGAVVQNWPDEDRAVRSNEVLLAQVAQRSGGRVFSIDEDPALVRVFERGGLPSAAGQRTIWGLLAVLAAVLLLIDIAVRRIVPDKQRRQVLARRAAGLGGAAAGSASTAWKQVKAKAAARRATQSRPDPIATVSPQPPAETEQDTPSEHEPQDESTMSRLRAVRKRLREQDDES